MATTYVLHGGETAKDLPGNKQFFRQFTSLVAKEEVKILLCYWARSKTEWNKLSQRDTQYIVGSSKKKASLSIVENVNDLYTKLKESDVLYVAGGEAELLEPYYPDLKGLGSALTGKIYLGSSMGAFMVSNHYVLSFDSQDKNVVHKGLGLLPINTLCHWNIEKEKDMKIKILKEKDSLSPILLLDEGEFSVFV